MLKSLTVQYKSRDVLIYLGTNMAHDPSIVRAHTSVSIGESNSARNDPRGHSDDKVADDEGATAVAIAHALSGGVQSADNVVVHELTVDDVVTAAALLVGEGGRGQGLQVIGQNSLMLGGE